MRNAILRFTVSRRVFAPALFGPITRLLLLLTLAILQQTAFATAAPLIAQQISTSNSSRHACAIVNGGVQCWGYNYDGQLGNGGFLDSAQPAPVYGLQSGVTAISVGGDHTCVIVNGGAKCWGRNPDGELGNGNLDDSAIPVAVQGLGSGVIAISAGAYHTCAIVTGGSVKCWGWNSNGQLGNNTVNATNTGTPTAVSNIGSGATQLASGGYHTCALVSGAVQCWGYNHDGQLDNGSIADSHIPVAASSLSGVSTIAAGQYHTCAIVSGGAVKCWGYNFSGQLGNNTTTSTTTGAPVSVTGMTSGATALAGGGYHSCAIVSGAAKCWGYNMFGQLGIGSLTDSHIPVAISGLSSGITAIVASLSDTCVQVTVSATSQVKCWGINLNGEVGLGDQIYRPLPVAVSAIPSGATALAQSATALHSCAIVSGGAKCWGDNEVGELGNNSIIDSSTPVAVSTLTANVTAIATGAYHSCAVVGGAAKCWGSNYYGQLGNNSNTNSSVPVTAIASGVTAIATSYWHTCAIVSGGVKCWGHNPAGELGNASTSDSSIPVTVSGLTGTAIAIASGSSHTCVVLQTGKIQCWGYNSNGQLGNNSNTSTLTNPPVLVSGINSGASAVIAGGYHTCAIVSGGMQCWGDGQVGQLGNGGAADSFTPVAVTGLGSGVSAIAAGGNYTCAIASSAVQCWGAFYTLAGVGSVAIYTLPHAVAGLSANVSAIGTGYSNACVIVSGAVLCEGTDYFGELGDGRMVFSEAPMTVVQGDRIFYDGIEGY